MDIKEDVLSSVFEMIVDRLSKVEGMYERIEARARLEDNLAPAGACVSMALHTKDGRQGVIKKLYTRLPIDAMVMVYVPDAMTEGAYGSEGFPSLSDGLYDDVRGALGPYEFERLRAADNIAMRASEERGNNNVPLCSAVGLHSDTGFEYLCEYLIEVAVRHKIREVLAMGDNLLLLTIKDMQSSLQLK